MKRKTKILSLATIVIGLLVSIGYLAFFNSPLGIIMRGNPNTGTWEDDPQNWNRAFRQDPPADVSIVHSYYWESDHFTHEYIYFFEVKASQEWQDVFLKEQKVEPVAPTNAWSFRHSHNYDDTPEWFAPDPVENYDVWDKPKYHGSIWINKTNGHIHFYGVQL